MSSTVTSEPDGAPQLLKQAKAYRERTRSVTVIETHISWIFLTDRFAYKLKKPVAFEFLDYSTPQLRKRACEREVELNRRLAPDVYVKVLPITHTSRGRLGLNQPGIPVDWVVKMRRLPADRTLERLICNQRLRHSQLESVAAVLADFYDRQAPLNVRPEFFRDQMRQHVRANRGELRKFFPHLVDLIDQVHDAQLRYVELRPALFDSRVCDGRVVDGHGDLRPEHIYLESQPVIIDCLEFNDEYRQVDIIDELCFLSMECDLLGAADVGEEIMNTYSAQAGDFPDASLKAFYKCYRACVRAKVTALRAAQLHSSPLVRHQAENYLRLSATYLPPLGPTALIVVGGPMGSGKSTLARSIARKLGACLKQTNATEHEVHGTPAPYDAASKGGADERCPPQVYDELLQQADRALLSGKSIVLDGNFLTDAPRQQARALARRRGACPLFVWCRCPRESALLRLEQRASGEDGLTEIRSHAYDAQIAESASAAADLPLLEVDTTLALNAQRNVVLERLATQLF
jgi:aminoglycoside phosphotransferase family enzyme/predicted kinase